MEGGQDFHEISPPTAPVVEPEDVGDEVVVKKSAAQHFPISDEDQLKLLVVGLREELKKQRKATGGNKGELRLRLKEALLEEVPVYNITKAKAKAKPKVKEGMPGFEDKSW